MYDTPPRATPRLLLTWAFSALLTASLATTAGCGDTNVTPDEGAPADTGPSDAGPDDVSGDDVADASAADAGTDATSDADEDVAPDTPVVGGLTLTSPEPGAFLEEATVDVEVEVTGAGALNEVTLEVMGTDGGTQVLDESGSATLTFEAVDLSAWDGQEVEVLLEAVGELRAGGELSSEPVAVVVDTRRGALGELEEVSAIPPVVDWRQNGTPGFVHLDAPAPGDSDDPVERAWQVVEAWPELFRVEDPRRELAPRDVRRSGDGNTEVRFHQRVGAMPVDSAYLTIALGEDGERVLAVAGHLVGDLPEPEDPRLSRQEAEEVAMEGLAPVAARALVVGHTRRVVYDDGLFDSGGALRNPQFGEEASQNQPLLAASRARIAWRVNVQGFDTTGGHPGDWEVFVDARTGRLLRTLSRVDEAIKDLRVKVLNADGKTASDGASECMSSFVTRTSPACFQNIDLRDDGCNDNADSDGEAAQMRQSAIRMHDWLDGNFGWVTNEEGGLIKPIVNVNFSDSPTAQSMSGFCGNQVQFSNGSAFPDVFYHEMGHRLVDETGAAFNDGNEPGALDEHYADMFGALIEGEDDGVGFDPEQGEDLGSPIRDIESPSGSNRSTYAGRYQGPQDNGGEHWNSTIASRPYWFLSQGGTYGGYEIEAFTPAELRTVIWETLNSSMISSSTTFSGNANAAVTVARREIGADAACDLRNANAAVGIIPGDANCDGTLDNASSDDDGDGDADGSDNCPRTFNPSQRDLDGDGAGDACDDDDDGDGVDDDEDNCPERANSMQEDTNGDDVGDVCQDLDGDLHDGWEDNCPMTENFSQDDTDGDGQGDVCDDDDDGDSVDDGDDNCPRAVNPGQADRNDNGTGDACDDPDDDGVVDRDDPCPDTFSHPNPDRDDDGLLDACEDEDDDNDGIDDANDNCRFTPNVEQVDFDDDGVGFECDNCPRLANPDQANQDNDGAGDACDADTDGDGVGDGSDNCPNTPNSRQIDTDADGQGDACGDSRSPEWLHRRIEAAQAIEANFPDLFDPDIDDASDTDLGGPFVGGGVPLDVCKVAICRDMGRVPAGFQVDVGLSADFPFRAVIVDGQGQVVRRLDPEQLQPGESAELQGTLTFQPPTGAYVEAEGMGDQPFQGSTYRLRVVADPEFSPQEPGESRRVNLGVDERVPE